MNYEKMVTDNLGLAHMMVRKYPLPKGYDYEDMYQEVLKKADQLSMFG